MFRKYYLVEVVILLLLSHGGWNGPSVTLLSCTSEASKIVRDVVLTRVSPVVSRYGVELPLECPLHPERDLFWRVEGAWLCPACGRRFPCEGTFVAHWDTKHARSRGLTGETVCLDDYCDVFRCDVLRWKQKIAEETETKRTQDPQQPTTGLSAMPDEQNLQRLNEQCDPLVMNRLQNKCRSLIRQCTVGMLSNLSNKDFQDIEDDLDQSICSFLTCDKYWDDYEHKVRHVPIVIVAVLILIFVGGFCFCYYEIYIILEKIPSNTSQICPNCQRSRSIEPRPRHHRPRHRQTSPSAAEEIRKSAPSRQNSPEFYKDHSEHPHNGTVPKRHESPVSLTPSRQNSPEYGPYLRAPSRQNSLDCYNYSIYSGKSSFPEESNSRAPSRLQPPNDLVIPRTQYEYDSWNRRTQREFQVN